MNKLDNIINITDTIEIDLDFLPIDLIMDFLDVYLRFVETKTTNIDVNKLNVLQNYKWMKELLSTMQQSNILNDVLKWAAPEVKVEITKKKVKSKYELNLYSQLAARVEEYLSIKNA